MVNINFDKAKSFLENIGNKDNILIIHHNDLDGFSSGILFYDFCLNKNCNVQTIAFNYGDSFNLKLLENFDKVIICDIGVNGLNDIFNELIKLEKIVFYTDHHINEVSFEEKNILEFVTTKQGYIPSSRTAYELVGGRNWLSLAGVLADKGDLYKENDLFIEGVLNELGYKKEEFFKEVVILLSNVLVYFEKDYDKAFFSLEKINDFKNIVNLRKYSEGVEEEFQRNYNLFLKQKEVLGKINFFYFNPKYSIKGPLISKISTEFEGLFVFVTPLKNKKGFLGISARQNNQEINLVSFLKKCLEDFNESSCGGHKNACGGYFRKEDLEKFKENLRIYSP